MSRKNFKKIEKNSRKIFKKIEKIFKKIQKKNEKIRPRILKNRLSWGLSELFHKKVIVPLSEYLKYFDYLNCVYFWNNSENSKFSEYCNNW